MVFKHTLFLSLSKLESTTWCVGDHFVLYICKVIAVAGFPVGLHS